MKKEISDHLARVFLETRLPEKILEAKEPKEKSFFFFVAVSAAVIGTLILAWSFLSQSAIRRAGTAPQVVTIDKHDVPYVLKYNFTDSPSKIETLSVEMDGMDLKGFTRMRFAIRINDTQIKNLGSIKVSLTNARRESSSIYLSEIHSSWKTVELPLSAFTHIYDWTCLQRLSFTLEAWNITPKTGELLIDGIEFMSN